MRNKNQPIANAVLASVLLIITLGIAFYGTDGIRGTDQYWYLHDVQTLQQESTTTNIYYPGNILRQGGVDSTPNYFVHNSPLLHLVAMISQPDTAFKCWIWINFLCHLLIAASIYLVTVKFTEDRCIPTWATAFYLISPIAVWQTINMLQEQFLAGLIALAAISYVHQKHIFFQMILIATLLVGILSHPLFFILAILYCLSEAGIAFHSKDRLKTIIVAGLACIFVIAKTKAEQLFPNSFQPTLTSIIGGSIPGKTNMLWQFSDTPISIDAQLLFNKLFASIKAHVFSLRDAPLYIYTNLALLSVVYLLIFHLKKYRRILLPCAACLGLYLAISVLMQAQARYQQIAASATFITIALCAYELRHLLKNRLVQLFGAGLFIASLTLSFYMMHTVRTQSETERVAMATIKKFLSDMPPSERILLLDSEHELFLGYTLAPRKVLTIKTSLISMESAKKAIALFDPAFLITTQKSAADAISHTTVDQINTASMGTIYRFGLN